MQELLLMFLWIKNMRKSHQSYSNFNDYIYQLGIQIRMYSLTETGIHLLQQPQQNQPIVKMQCKCNRLILQEQIYTCINCSSYSCYYCTIPEFASNICRSCKRNPDLQNKNSKCNFCFSCPFCHNVLTLTKDPKSKFWIYLCQFCYWNSKQVNMKEQRAEILQDNLFKLSNLREVENKIYNTALTFFKQTNNSTQMQNQSLRYTHNKRPSIRSSLEQSSRKDKEQLNKINQSIQTIIRHSSLDDDTEQYVGNQSKFPQALPLLSKKTRRCPDCTKPLTNIYRPVVSNEPAVELMHKELKVIQAQRLAPVDGKVRIKFLKACLLNEKTYKQGDQEEIQVGKVYPIKATIQNKRKNVEVVYQIVIIPHKR